MRRYLTACLLLTIMAACTQTPATEAPPGTFAPVLRDQPTLSAPKWVEGAEAITLENAPFISYIGRLDTVSTPSTVFAYAFSPDGTQLAGLNNDQLIVWDLISGQLVFNTARDQALYVYYSADKSEVYTVDDIGEITIYNADTGAVKDTLDTQVEYNGVAAYYADEGWLALGGSDAKVQVWDPSARQSLGTFIAGTGPLRTLAFSEDGERLGTAAFNGSVQIWDWRNQQSQSSINEASSRLAFSPDGSQLAVGGDQKIDLWDISANQQIFSLATGPGAITDVLQYSPDNQFLMNGGGIPEITVWDTVTGKLINRLPGVGGDSTSASFSPDGRLLVTSVLGGAVNLWDMTQIRQPELSYAEIKAGTRQILYADWSDDGYLLLLFDATGPIQVWGIAPQPTPPPS